MMKRESLRRTVVGLVSPLLVAVMITAAAGQEPAKTAGAKPADKPAAASKTRKKPRGRLPAYFSKVVTDKQRNEIYDIQAKYNEQIAKLQEQLDALVTKRDTEVDDVLSDEQRAEVEKFRMARRKKTGKSATASTSSG